MQSCQQTRQQVTNHERQAMFYQQAADAYSDMMDRSDRWHDAEEATYHEVMSACETGGVCDPFPPAPHYVMVRDWQTKLMRHQSLGDTLVETLDYRHDFSAEILVQIILDAARGNNVQDAAHKAVDRMARIYAEYNTPEPYDE